MININTAFIQKVIKDVSEVQRQASRHHLMRSDKLEVLMKDEGKDYTTAVDRTVEAELKCELLQRFPEIGFLGEEYWCSSVSSQLIWVVDPTDGTAVFQTGGEYYSSSIALIDRELKKVIFGSVYQPKRDRQFVRAQGEGIWIREKIIKRDGTIVYEERKPVPSLSQGIPELMTCIVVPSKHLHLWPALKEKSNFVFKKEVFPELKREYGLIDAKPASGSSALYICDIADGNRHAAVLFFQKVWDIAVGALYAKDAGCIVECGGSLSTLSGGNLEKVIAESQEETLINVAVYANSAVKRIVEQKFEQK